MYENEFFVVDMASCTSTGEIINSLSLALETLNHSGKKIVLKLNDNYLNQSQMLSIQSLITSYGCILDTVETVNKDTAQIAENMNILVQEPIEKRIEEKYGNDLGNDQFGSKLLPSDNIDSDKIAVKEVTGLHFEADLDAIQKQQDSIDVSSELRQAGISRESNFEEIEQAISNKYQLSQETKDIVEEFTKFTPTIDIPLQTIDTPSSEIKPEQSDLNLHDKTDDLEAEKNSIGVYKKAYDEYSGDKDEWEEVDFYETPTNEPVVSDTKVTVYINQTLRSGQTIESDGNVLIIGDCHPGSEIRAVGDITVWGILSGVAHAGCKGNTNATIRALKMNAVQLRIANCYSRRPDTTNIPYIIKSSVFTPEEARLVDNEIMLFKINQN